VIYQRTEAENFNMFRMKNPSCIWYKPSFWGTLYLLLIPAYALIYQWLLPEKSFFHATMQHEPGIQGRSRSVLKQLWDSYSASGPSDTGECQSLSPATHSVDLGSLRIDGDDVSFFAVFYLAVARTESYQAAARVHFSLERNFDLPFHLLPGKGRGTIYKEVRLDGIEANPWGKPVDPALITRCLFPSGYGYRLPRDLALLRISVPVDEQVHDLADDLRGIPRRESAGIWRMLYLSASTITTAGFGDIVPVTNSARLLVTSEAILGVVLVGMFLNALAKRTST
jgi:Ion channel